MKIKAAVLFAPNSPLEIEEIENLPLESGQVLVQVLSSGICGAQLQELRGEKGEHFPRLMGHEGCGVVVEVGPGANKFRGEDRVCMHWRKAEGADSNFPEYKIRGKSATSGKITTFSEYAVVSENRLTKVPNHTPIELASLLGCALSTALGVMENDAQLKAGESVLIVGCGGVGLNLIRVAKMMGASRVVGHDKDIVKVVNAGNMGADFQRFGLKNPSEKSKFDVIVDTTGNVDAIEAAIPLLAPSGRMILVGQPKPGADLILYGARHLFDGEGKSIKATQGGGFQPDTDIPRYVRMWKSGHLKIDGIVTHRIPFLQINEAIEMVKSGNAGRVMLEMV